MLGSPRSPRARARGASQRLIVRGLLRRPPTGATPTLTLCSVHLHNVVAKKRDAATVLLRRLHAHMVRLDVDFVGGDLNMVVKWPVADVFNNAEFMAPRSSPLWGAGGLEGAKADCTGFLCMPRRPLPLAHPQTWGPYILQ